MGRLNYTGIVSLDGYINDAAGNFDWAAPDEEVHAFINDLERSAGTYLYGRRMYEVMKFWQTVPEQPDESAVMIDFAEVWRAAEKIVFSTSLEAVDTPRTRIERTFDPYAVARLKADQERDLSIGGATLAATAIAAGLVDEFHLFLTPVIVGGGTPFFPDGVKAGLRLEDERRFASGIVYLRYTSQV
ncbi:dihydrofolate reductase family protein [Salinibacterium sp. ZJ450]|uniref:dihydrofolate reductase family protein n=1 Tax=Salinibacterium sp. ZJ450 TaxID=2708338 RepID=UPI0014249998|nr:dihydrofolate reductase family protein [Salinibacterium sp. ZJ450]